MMKMKTKTLLAALAAATGIAAGTANAATVTSLPASPTQTFTSIGALSGIGDDNRTSFAGANYDVVSETTNVDQLDATFAMTVTLAAHTTAGQQVLFETGGAVLGFALSYEAGNVLVLRASDNPVVMTATSAALAPGTYDLIWTFDHEPGNGDESIALYIDGALAATGTDTNWDATGFSGGDLAGFGQTGGGTAIPGGGTGVAFADGSIDTTRGLEFYGDTLFVVPEPGSLALLGLGGLLIARRRRG